uniref:Secreted protein n=1 Tax=Tetraselmis sp. GSL018 TaxID=582737 RepID=A0A061SK67_9CHLO
MIWFIFWRPTAVSFLPSFLSSEKNLSGCSDEGHMVGDSRNQTLENDSFSKKSTTAAKLFRYLTSSFSYAKSHNPDPKMIVAL